MSWAGEPCESFESGLRKTVEWYLANRSWWERIRAKGYRGERLGGRVMSLAPNSAKTRRA